MTQGAETRKHAIPEAATFARGEFKDLLDAAGLRSGTARYLRRSGTVAVRIYGLSTRSATTGKWADPTSGPISQRSGSHAAPQSM